MPAKAQDLYCIYCLERRPVAAFNREHVVPDSFGRFKGALTIIRGVCQACNTHFNKVLDRVLARETFEGMLRYHVGVKSPDEARKFRPGERVRLELDVPGPHAGSLVTVVPRVGGPGVAVEQVPQIRLEDPTTGEFAYFTEDEARRPGWPPPQFRNRNLNIGLVAREDAAVERLEGIVRSVGFGGRFEDAPPTPGESQTGKIPVKARVQIDDDLRRVMAKISFNYLAAVQGVEFALESDFNDIRAYIRHGIKCPQQCVYPTLQPSLVGEEAGKMQGRALAHLLGVGWSDPPDMLVGQVALFNAMQYRVILSPRYRGARPTIASGHAYLVGPREVVKTIPLGFST